MKLEQFEAALAALSARMEVLEAKMLSRPAPTRAAPVEPDGVRIFHSAGAAYPMPSKQQLLGLQGIVHRQQPRLRPELSRKWAEQDEEDAFRGFCSAFEFIGTLGRTPDKTEKKFYLDHWIEAAVMWCRPRGLPTTIDGNSFLTAVIAHGDIPFILKDDLGNVPTVGLREFGGSPGGSAWRQVLETEKVLAPLGINSKPLYPEPRVEIR